jgi:co-chaperonin GroES (HSP10)
MIKPLKNRVLVTDIQKDERVINGIVVPSDDGKEFGVRPRWGKVYAVGDGVVDVNPDEWILIEHGRWSRELNVKEENLVLWGVDYPDGILVISDEEPSDEYFNE